jgi:hypothetical protein
LEEASPPQSQMSAVSRCDTCAKIFKSRSLCLRHQRIDHRTQVTVTGFCPSPKSHVVAQAMKIISENDRIEKSVRTCIPASIVPPYVDYGGKN